MFLYILSLAIGLVVLVWSADKFVDGASAIAKHYGMPPLLIGMVIIGFGTSAPEMVVSALASFQGNAGIALGNAYGSNITNITLILGVTALLMIISVHSQVLRKELPILNLVTLLSIEIVAKDEQDRTGDEQALYRRHPEFSISILKNKKFVLTDNISKAIE